MPRGESWWRRFLRCLFPPKDKGSLRELSHVLGFLENRLPGLQLPGADNDVAIASMALLRAAMVQGAAVLTLGRTEVAESAEVNLRSLFEAWVNLRFLLLHGDRTRNARKYIASAYLELRDYVAALGDSEEDVAKLDALLEKLKQADPAAVQEVVTQREDRKWHWSGLNLTKVIDTVGAALPPKDVNLRQVYKLMSWGGHHDIAVIRDVQRTALEDGEHVTFKHWQPQEETAEFCAYGALGFLADCWTVFAGAFGLPLIDGK